MSESTITSKGQITIPKVVREALHLEVGDRVYFEVLGDGSVVLKARNQPVERLFGLLHGRSARRRVLSVEEMNPASGDDRSP
ncbi:MAG TPA: AbrB/MazE/SpoVT family DNA-binding domain-containing protein [Gemmatimonadaceae bacterium]|nr:AbrB/MazE/SpoVT family DNA-binding domain-containing protein [Gemmatimonadaceae bacterium]